MFQPLDNIHTSTKICHHSLLDIDFAKAFDTVSHSKLLYRLKLYGIDGCLLKWIERFLSGRSHTTRVGVEQWCWSGERGILTELSLCLVLWFTVIIVRQARKSVTIAYFDFAKAFDTVSHPKLLYRHTNLQQCQRPWCYCKRVSFSFLTYCKNYCNCIPTC